MMSGIRNAPPISTSSPRDTTASPSRASAERATRRAPAALFTTSASPAPVSSIRRSRHSAWREPRVPRARSYSRFEYPAAMRLIASRAERASGARPRLVCSTTPVALITGRSDGAARRCTRARTAAPQPSGGAAPPLARACSIVSRTARTTRPRGCAVRSAATSGSASSASTAGSRRRGSVTAPWPWWYRATQVSARGSRPPRRRRPRRRSARSPRARARGTSRPV